MRAPPSTASSTVGQIGATVVGQIARARGTVVGQTAAMEEGVATTGMVMAAAATATGAAAAAATMMVSHGRMIVGELMLLLRVTVGVELCMYVLILLIVAVN